MALTDESGMNYSMPVAPMNYGGGFGNGFGGDGAWLILFIILMMNGGWGNGFGGFGGMNDLYPWMNNSQNINNGFRDQMLNTSVQGIQNAVTSGFGDVQNSLCGGFAGVNATVNGAQNAISSQMYGNTIADLERSFAVQTAQMQGMNALQNQLSTCCCDNRAGLADVKYTIATEACADRSAVTDALQNVTAQGVANTNALMSTITNGIQNIKDQLCADKIESKNDTIAQLRSELMYARGQASQDVQTAAIQAGQRALANEVEQYINPTPRPSYIVPNPYCCNNATGCGCGSF
jgi:hypothetical protein